MMASVHAAVGAAIGRLVGHRGAAFGAGVVSHLLCDLMPHRDLTPKVEASLLALVLGAIALRRGIDSPEMAGAAGAVAPDLENAAHVVGAIPFERMVFPSHQGDHSHGPKMTSIAPQVALAALCLAVALAPRRS